MILFIDTTDFNKVAFAISRMPSLARSGTQGIDSGHPPEADSGMTIKKTYKINPHESHKILAHLDEFLKKSKIKNPQSEIKRIMVNKGPGSFTGVRVGVTIAMALGFAWGAPVKAVGKEQFKIEHR